MPISEKWTAAEAAAGPSPPASSSVADVTPYPMPSEPSTSWASSPTRASRTSLRMRASPVAVGDRIELSGRTSTPDCVSDVDGDPVDSCRRHGAQGLPRARRGLRHVACKPGGRCP